MKVSPFPSGRIVKENFHHHRATETSGILPPENPGKIMFHQWGMPMLVKLTRTEKNWFLKFALANTPNKNFKLYDNVHDFSTWNQVKTNLCPRKEHSYVYDRTQNQFFKISRMLTQVKFLNFTFRSV